MKMLPFLILLLTLQFSFTLLNAQHTNHVEGPYFAVSGDVDLEAFPLLETKANAIINGAIADVTISQIYVNNGQRPIEAIYTFPASMRAAIYHMEMHIGDRVLVAEIQEKGKARKMYENAKDEGKRSSLLEQHRPNVFQMNVANIMPGDQISIDMRYTEFLIPEDQKYKFVYPIVVGPRYTGEDKKAPSAVFANMPYGHSNENSSYNFDIDVQLNMGMPVGAIHCLSHQVDVNYSNPSNAQVSLVSGQEKSGNRDYMLEYSLAGNEIETGLLTFESEDENFFLVQLEAPEICSAPRLSPREYIFIVDVSGSMNGFPLEASKELMQNLLTGLRSHDKFNIMFFAGSAYSLSEESLNATPENIKRSVQVFNNMQGGGGTNMVSAIKKAMALPKTSGTSRSMVIITDGYVSVEEEAFKVIGTQLGRANFFAFGIGESVNHYIIDGIAHIGRAESLVVVDKRSAREAAAKLKQYIEYPVMTDISLSYDGVELFDLQPMSIPDLMANRPIYLFGKYKKQEGGSLTIRGLMGDEIYHKTVNISPSLTDTKALSYLWAREKIRYLDDMNNGRKTNERIAEITGLGLKYNLLTKYTSFIAIDEKPIVKKDPVVSKNKKSQNAKNKPAELTTVRQPLPMPQSVPNSAIGFEMELGDIISDEKSTGMLSIDVESIDISSKIMMEAILETFIKKLDSPDVIQYLLNQQFEVSYDGQRFVITGLGGLPVKIKGVLINLLKKSQFEKVLQGTIEISISINNNNK